MSLLKPLLTGTFAACFSAALTTVASAQAVKVGNMKVEVQLQESPDIEFKRTKDKKWTARNWVEIETAFQAEGGDPKSDFIDELEFHYFVYFKEDKSTPPRIFNKVIKLENVPKKDTNYTIAFVTPNQVESIYGKGKTAKPGDVWVAIEVKYRGTLVGGEATEKASSKWWRSSNSQSVQGGVMAKGETPFSLLWYDRHVQEKKER